MVEPTVQTRRVSKVSRDGVQFDKIYNISELPLEVRYRVIKYKRVHGSCGLYFILQAKRLETNEIILVRVNEGNLFNYLKDKTSKSRFTISHERSETDENHVNVSGKSNWIELTEKTNSQARQSEQLATNNANPDRGSVLAGESGDED